MSMFKGQCQAKVVNKKVNQGEPLMPSTSLFSGIGACCSRGDPNNSGNTFGQSDQCPTVPLGSPDKAQHRESLGEGSQRSSGGRRIIY